ncbi:MAG: methyltransferase domain-containing protein [Chloroflexi bacterium]|nr:methyltransferase domain-containing protein [Chloroflexota bacterium]
MDAQWYYDDFQHISIDFDDADLIATYTQKQGSTPQDEQALIQRLGIQADDVVIEMGCGTGVFAIEAAKVGKQVFAVDISEPMLEYATQAAAEQSIQNIKFIHGGFLSYEQANPKANFIITKFALHHLPDFWKVIAFRRMADMLADGGILYLKDIIYSFPVSTYQDTINQWIKDVAKPADKGFTRQEFELHVREEFSTFSWIIENMLTRTGFEILESDTRNPTYGEFIAVKRW